MGEARPLGSRLYVAVGVLLILAYPGRFEAYQFRKLLAVGVVAVEAFLERAVVFGYELLVLRAVVFGQLLELSQKLLDGGRLDAAENAVLLEYFAADVQREILAVDDSPYEAEIHRQELLVVVGDEHAFDEELHAAFIVGVEHVEGRLLRNVEQRRVFLGSLGLRVYIEQRIFAVVGKRLVETLVVFFLEFALRLLPDRARVVDLLGGHRLGGSLSLVVVFLLEIVQVDGECDVVGIALDDVFDLPSGGEFLVVVVQVHDDCRAVRSFANAFNQREGRVVGF